MCMRKRAHVRSCSLQLAEWTGESRKSCLDWPLILSASHLHSRLFSACRPPSADSFHSFGCTQTRCSLLRVSASSEAFYWSCLESASVLVRACFANKRLSKG